MKKEKIIFVINPKAGKKKKINIIDFINKEFKTTHNYECIVWQNKDDFDKIKEYVLNNGFTIAVAVGGDGTVNKLASCLVNTTIALGIIPLGSGNGLARSLSVPMSTKKALDFLNEAVIKKIDSCSINGKAFFCTAGVGFDAHIGKLFAESTTRGLKSYIKIILKEFFKYKPNDYLLEIDGHQKEVKAFLITFANAGQYGNDFYIAPQASLSDGLITTCVLKPFRAFSVFSIVMNILLRRTTKSPKFNYQDGKNITVKSKTPVDFHFDGEPGNLTQELNIHIFPSSLNVLSMK